MNNKRAQSTEARSKRPGEPAVDAAPKRLFLHALDEEWHVKYLPADRLGIRLQELKPRQLVVSGQVHDLALCRRILQRWLVNKGKRHLIPWLRQLAQRHGFTFNRVQIRLQKTRWGSCSGRGTISLNAKLLFLPTYLARYVLIHELCHTVHLNHSKEFWELVGRYEPELPHRRREMRKALQYVPYWLR